MSAWEWTKALLGIAGVAGVCIVALLSPIHFVAVCAVACVVYFIRQGSRKNDDDSQ